MIFLEHRCQVQIEEVADFVLKFLPLDPVRFSRCGLMRVGTLHYKYAAPGILMMLNKSFWLHRYFLILFAHHPADKGRFLNDCLYLLNL